MGCQSFSDYPIPRKFASISFTLLSGKVESGGVKVRCLAQEHCTMLRPELSPFLLI